MVLKVKQKVIVKNILTVNFLSTMRIVSYTWWMKRSHFESGIEESLFGKVYVCGFGSFTF